MNNVTLAVVVLALLAAPVAQAGKLGSSSSNNNKDKACAGLTAVGTTCTVATGPNPVCLVVDAAALGCHLWVWRQKQD